MTTFKRVRTGDGGKYWDFIEELTKLVARWPEWKRAPLSLGVELEMESTIGRTKRQHRAIRNATNKPKKAKRLRRL